MVFKCKHCNSSIVIVKKADGSPHTGLYCADCGKWITWLGKKQIGDRELSRQLNDSLRILDARKSKITNSTDAQIDRSSKTEQLPFDIDPPTSSTIATISIKQEQGKLVAYVQSTTNSEIDLTTLNVVISKRGVVMQNVSTLAACVVTTFD